MKIIKISNNELHKVVRYTDSRGVGLFNRDTFSMDKLDDDEDQELTELLSYGMQQPKDVPADVLFFFTLDGEQISDNKRLIELLSKASKRGVIRHEFTVKGEPVWKSSDGQVAYKSEMIVK